MDAELYKKTQDKVGRGWLMGPIPWEDLGSYAAVSKRFGIQQGSKLRPIDDFSMSSVFFLLERHLAQVAWSLSVLNLICIPQSTYALDQGGVEPRQAVSPRPGGQGRYRFATASVDFSMSSVNATVSSRDQATADNVDTICATMLHFISAL